MSIVGTEDGMGSDVLGLRHAMHANAELKTTPEANTAECGRVHALVRVPNEKSLANREC